MNFIETFLNTIGLGAATNIVRAIVIFLICWIAIKVVTALTAKLLDKAGFGENDFLFVLGDVIDRGEEGVELLRWLVNQPNIHAGGNSPNNGLSPTITLGCGFWGGNSITENLTFANMRNYTRVAFYNPDAEPYDFDHIFDD